MKQSNDMVEGSEAFKRFKNTMKAVLSVPHEEIQKRVEAHRKKAAKNPNKPGPKRKSASSLRSAK